MRQKPSNTTKTEKLKERKLQSGQGYEHSGQGCGPCTKPHDNTLVDTKL